MAPFRPISIHALCEEGDAAHSAGSRRSTNFYPRPLRGGRRHAIQLGAEVKRISIHALCEEGDTDDSFAKLKEYIFLSTPSARRATHEQTYVY